MGLLQLIRIDYISLLIWIVPEGIYCGLNLRMAIASCSRLHLDSFVLSPYNEKYSICHVAKEHYKAFSSAYGMAFPYKKRYKKYKRCEPKHQNINNLYSFDGYI